MVNEWTQRITTWAGARPQRLPGTLCMAGVSHGYPGEAHEAPREVPP